MRLKTKMKDRETAFRTSEHPSQSMAIGTSPVPLTPFPFTIHHRFSLMHPLVLSVIASAIVWASSVLVHSQKQKVKIQALVVTRNHICL